MTEARVIEIRVFNLQIKQMDLKSLLQANADIDNLHIGAQGWQDKYTFGIYSSEDPWPLLTHRADLFDPLDEVKQGQFCNTD